MAYEHPFPIKITLNHHISMQALHEGLAGHGEKTTPSEQQGAAMFMVYAAGFEPHIIKWAIDNNYYKQEPHRLAHNLTVVMSGSAGNREHLLAGFGKELDKFVVTLRYDDQSMAQIVLVRIFYCDPLYTT